VAEIEYPPSGLSALCYANPLAPMANEWSRNASPQRRAQRRGSALALAIGHWKLGIEWAKRAEKSMILPDGFLAKTVVHSLWTKQGTLA